MSISSLSIRVPKAKIPGESKYIVLPIHKNGELKLKEGTKNVLLNFLINLYGYVKTQGYMNRIISIFKHKETRELKYLIT